MDSNNQQIYSIIRNTVPASEIARVLGLQVNQHGRCRCPFHNGHDMNMRIYPGNRGYYCFVCHAGGDCISLAKQLLPDHVNYYEAAKWIDKTFDLRLIEEHVPTIRERRIMAERRKRGVGA